MSMTNCTKINKCEWDTKEIECRLSNKKIIDNKAQIAVGTVLIFMIYCIVI
jgi:hypothetical protein